MNVVVLPKKSVERNLSQLVYYVDCAHRLKHKLSHTFIKHTNLLGKFYDYNLIYIEDRILDCNKMIVGAAKLSQETVNSNVWTISFAEVFDGYKSYGYVPKLFEAINEWALKHNYYISVGFESDLGKKHNIHELAKKYIKNYIGRKHTNEWCQNLIKIKSHTLAYA